MVHVPCSSGQRRHAPSQPIGDGAANFGEAHRDEYAPKNYPREDLGYIPHIRVEVSHPDTRKARRHPGEGRPAHTRVHRPPRDAGNANDIEGTIRGYAVRPRNIRRILPDREAAHTPEIPQSVQAACRIRGMFSVDVVAGDRNCRAFGSGKPPPIPGLL